MAALAPFIPAAAGQTAAIGDEVVLGIAPSPQFTQTGTVVVAAQDRVCPPRGGGCFHLWISRDGGATWRPAAAEGWNHQIPQVAVRPDGREDLLAGGPSGLQVSLDLGASWRVVGPAGTLTVGASYQKDGTLTLAGSQDYLVQRGVPRPVAGSRGSLLDQAFMLAPDYPTKGRFPPALLTGVDPSSRQTAVEACVAALACTRPVPLGPFADAELFPSSNYAADGVVFAVTGQQIFKSHDGGGGFTPITVTDSGNRIYRGFALVPGYRETGGHNTAYVAISPAEVAPGATGAVGGLFVSHDGGTRWSLLSDGRFDRGATAVAAPDATRLLAGYDSGAGAGLLCSQDGGRTWRPACAPLVPVAAGAQTCGTSPCASPPSAAPSPTPSSPASTSPLGNAANEGESSGGTGAGLPGTMASLFAQPWVWFTFAAVLIVLVPFAMWRLGAYRGSGAPHLTGRTTGIRASRYAGAALALGAVGSLGVGAGLALLSLTPPRLLAFALSGPTGEELRLYTWDGKPALSLHPSLRGGFPTPVIVSPDGRHMVATDPSGTVRVLAEDGSAGLALAKNGTVLAWGDDDRRLCVVEAGSASESALSLIDPGVGARHVANLPGPASGYVVLACSPKNNRVLVARMRPDATITRSATAVTGLRLSDGAVFFERSLDKSRPSAVAASADGACVGVDSISDTLTRAQAELVDTRAGRSLMHITKGVIDGVSARCARVVVTSFANEDPKSARTSVRDLAGRSLWSGAGSPRLFEAQPDSDAVLLSADLDLIVVQSSGVAVKLPLRINGLEAVPTQGSL